MEELVAWGHPNVRATHRSTLEITKEDFLTPRGDCIVGVRASKSVADFSREFKKAARSPGSIITMRLEVDGLVETIVGRGHPSLTFRDEKSLVVRKSSYVCGRTLMVMADKAAIDLNREMVRKLQDPGQMLKVVIIVK